MPTPHKHADLIKKWADDPSQCVWIWSESARDWIGIDTPSWVGSCIYAIGPKPTQPPRKMCVLAGVEFPAPETVAPTMGTHMFSPDMYYGEEGVAEDPWSDDQDDRYRLDAGLLHLTREAAEQHSRALLAANKAAIEGAK